MPEVRLQIRSADGEIFTEDFYVEPNMLTATPSPKNDLRQEAAEAIVVTAFMRAYTNFTKHVNKKRNKK